MLQLLLLFWRRHGKKCALLHTVQPKGLGVKHLLAVPVCNGDISNKECSQSSVKNRTAVCVVYVAPCTACKQQ